MTATLEREAVKPSRSAALGRRITVIIPAHNEGKWLPATIESVLAQTRPADRILVYPNGCTDDTWDVAARYPVEVMGSHHSQGRKAGALNRALDYLLPTMNDHDLVMCMDGDTEVHPDLLRNAEAHMAADPTLGAVSSNHLITPTNRLIQLLQMMEYERDRRFIGRRKGNYGCMTGMAAVYRVAALRQVHRRYGSVYDPRNWTEDWKLTIALKHLRWRMIRPQDCLATTVPVTTIKGLYIQRERWARGYLQTLMQFGFTRWTAIPWLKQAGLVWSIVSRLLLILLLVGARHHLVAVWMIPVVVILVGDAINTVHKAGWRADLVALAFPLEIFYAWLVTAAIFSGYFKQLTGLGGSDTWKKVRR